MARSGESSKLRSKQHLLALRVPAELEDVLRMAIAFRDCQSMQQLLEEVVREFARDFAENPNAKVALEAKRAYERTRRRGVVRLADDQERLDGSA